MCGRRDGTLAISDGCAWEIPGLMWLPALSAVIVLAAVILSFGKPSHEDCRCAVWFSEHSLAGSATASPPRQSAIRNPQSAIRNPQSAIRNPKSEIRTPKSSLAPGFCSYPAR